MSKRMVIFGGSGFVGRSIASFAIKKKYEVIAISRKGKPKDFSPWMEKVQWVQADVFQFEKWASCISSGDIIVDAIGILMENKKKGITYQRFHFDSVKHIISSLEAKKPEVFVYISAAHGLPFFPDYLKWKKEAEYLLMKQNFPVILVKPSFLYGKNKKFSRLMAFPLVQVQKIPGIKKVFGKLNPQPIDLLGKAVIQTIEKRNATNSK